jgi:hypothetical protein
MKWLLATLAGIAQATVTTSPSKAPTSQAPSPAPVIFPDFCFNMGHKPGVDYVIKNGNATKVLDHETELYSIFYAWLDANHSITNCSTIHNWTVKEVAFPPGGLIHAVWKQEGDGRALPLNSSNVTSEALTIDWKCMNENKVYDGIVNITIGLWGYADVTFSLDKKCLPPIGPPTPAPSGWGAGSIFFFTVFILTMVFCIVGCGINYVQQGKTGLEIIPGASTCVGCLGKLFRQPRYTPQMDYDAPVGGQGHGNERFGASYQTDL